MPEPVRILITSVGRRGQLVAGFRAALAELSVRGEVCSADAGSTAPAAFITDAHFAVPQVTDPRFAPNFIALCARERVSLVIPTIDTELAVLADMRQVLLQSGTEVVVSDASSIAIAADKRVTHEFLVSRGLPCPMQWALDTDSPDSIASLPLPVVIKPARGSMSAGVEIVEHMSRLTDVLSSAMTEMVAETLASGVEYTVSTYVDRDGRCISAVPRERLEVRAGEVSKGRTAAIPEVQDLAARVVEALPGARGPLNVQIIFDPVTRAAQVIEINARFGGGDPLAWRSGANAPRWILEEHLGLEPTVVPWEEDLFMLRFDDAVFVPGKSLHGST